MSTQLATRNPFSFESQLATFGGDTALAKTLLHVEGQVVRTLGWNGAANLAVAYHPPHATPRAKPAVHVTSDTMTGDSERLAARLHFLQTTIDRTRCAIPGSVAAWVMVSSGYARPMRGRLVRCEDGFNDPRAMVVRSLLGVDTEGNTAQLLRVRDVGWVSLDRAGAGMALLGGRVTRGLVALMNSTVEKTAGRDSTQKGNTT